MYWIIGAVVLVFVFFIIPGNGLSKKIRKIQDICSERYYEFYMYVGTSTDFEFTKEKTPGSLRILYNTPFGLESKYLSYHGDKKIGKALDELISHFE